jgi:hypothetical protein
MSEVPQHKKLAATGDTGQDIAAATVGSSGKPSTDWDKRSLMDGTSNGDSNTLEPGKKHDAKSPW